MTRVFRCCCRSKLKSVFFTAVGIVLFCIFASYQFLRQYRTEVFRLDSPTVCSIPLIDPRAKAAKVWIDITGRIDGAPKCIGADVKFRIDYQNSSLVRNYPADNYWKSVDCCYTSYLRNPDKTIINGPECFPIQYESTTIPQAHQNLDIKCRDTLTNEIVYRDQFPIFRTDPNIESDIDAISSKISTDRLSVLILGLDSVSHQNLVRYMPKSYDFLTKNLEAIEFFGFNKVGRGTTANVVAMLTGCKLLNSLDPPFELDERCHLIWENYNNEGFRTVHFEDDFFNEGSLYPNIRKSRPGIGTHYNLSAFIYGMRWIDAHEMKGTFDDGYGCFDNQFVPDIFAQAIIEAAKMFAKTPYFNYVWLAKTTHAVISNTVYMDEPIYRILTELNDTGSMDDTILFVVSDHGPWYGAYLATDAGALERLMPVLYVVLPKSFRMKYSFAFQNMKLNSKRLTTPFDLYETLVDLTKLSNLDNDIVQKRMRSSADGPHQLGQSLFVPVPLERTCDSANIPPEYCTCWRRSSISSPQENIQVQQGAAYAVIHLNSEISLFPLCSPLKLKSIKAANWLGSRTDEQKGNDLLEVTFTTSPADAEFLVSLSMEPKLNIIGQVIRNNKYKGQSDCISSWTNASYVKTMCFCTPEVN